MDAQYVEGLKLAFAYDVVRRIVGADAVVKPIEAAFLDDSFPWSALAEHGFIDEHGAFTERFESACEEARRVLPDALGTPEKLAMISQFVDATLADDQLQIEEGRELVAAAAALGLAPDTWLAHLGTLQNVGSVDLPDPD